MIDSSKEKEIYDMKFSKSGLLMTYSSKESQINDLKF